MKDSQLLPTTWSGCRGNKSRYSLESPPPAAHISCKPEIVGKQYGWVKIISPEKRWNKKQNHCYVLTQCQGCGSIQWTLFDALVSGKSKGCQHCSQTRKIPLWLYKRLTAAKQRCENPRDPGYPNYGARGIRFMFPSVLAAGLYLLEHFGIPERGYEIDRINNNGDYAPGNLHMVPLKVNRGNRRLTVLSEFQQKYWPYAYTTVIRKLTHGESREQIIKDAVEAVKEKRKRWHIISARLDFMTYEMPDHITVLPYRDVSSTTVAMAGLLEH